MFIQYISFLLAKKRISSFLPSPYTDIPYIFLLIVV